MAQMETSRLETAYEAGVAAPPSSNGGFKRKLKNRGKLLLRQMFELGQRAGFDILPRHFYSEIPDINLLKNSRRWRAPLTMEGIAGGVDDQLQFADDCTAPFRANLAGLKIHQHAVRMNGSDEGYGEVEADFLYCFIRRYRPRTIIQVGCGVSTAVCLMAAKDEEYAPKIICIEPYPTKFLQDAHDSGQIQLVYQKVEDVELDYFRQLSAGDLFFVDSSHTLGPSGEASRLVLSILPGLSTGAFVHFHDIWFPYDYCPQVLSTDLFFFHETTLLYAFLCMNDRFSVSASLSLLFHAQQDALHNCLPCLKPGQFEDGHYD